MANNPQTPIEEPVHPAFAALCAHDAEREQRLAEALNVYLAQVSRLGIVDAVVAGADPTRGRLNLFHLVPSSEFKQANRQFSELSHLATSLQRAIGTTAHIDARYVDDRVSAEEIEARCGSEQLICEWVYR